MLIVQTTRRDGASYLEATLSGLTTSRDKHRIVVSDGPLPDGFKTPYGWAAIELPKRGARATGWACMEIGMDAKVPFLTLLQDDLVFCGDAPAVMDSTPVPPTCVATSFFCGFLPLIQPRQMGEPRIVCVPAGMTAQALKFPRSSLEMLAGFDPQEAPGIKKWPHYFDDAVFAYARESSTPNVAVLLPNPVRHVGEVSACGSKNRHYQPWFVREGGAFPGDPSSFDIFELERDEETDRDVYRKVTEGTR